MSVRNLSLPEHYFSKLDIMETEIAIKLAKDTFERELARCLELTRVSAPLFVQPETGLNDDLNGVERPVQFDILDLGSEADRPLAGEMEASRARALRLRARHRALHRYERHPP